MGKTNNCGGKGEHITVVLQESGRSASLELFVLYLKFGHRLRINAISPAL